MSTLRISIPALYASRRFPASSALILCILCNLVSPGPAQAAAAEDPACKQALHDQDFPGSRALYRPGVRARCRNVAGEYYHYSTDSLGRRSHGPSGSTGPAGPAVLALGCSFTFGIGVDDDETLPARLERILRRKVTNLGVPSGGLDPARWIYSQRGSLVPESKGSWLVYTMLPDHLHRHSRSGPWSLVVSPLDVRAGARGQAFKRNFGKLMRFAPARWVYERILTTWMKLFYRRRLAGAYATGEELESFASGLNRLAAEYFAENPGGKFFLNVWYLEKPPSVTASIDQLQRLLDPRITLVSMPGVERLPRIMSAEGVPDHPVPEAYQKAAEFLAAVFAGKQEGARRELSRRTSAAPGSIP